MHLILLMLIVTSVVLAGNSNPYTPLVFPTLPVLMVPGRYFPASDSTQQLPGAFDDSSHFAVGQQRAHFV